MKIILFFLIVLCSINYSAAQSLSPNVTSAAGNSFINGSSQLDWTLGEPAVSTLNNGSNMLTQGFHQGDLIITSAADFEAGYELTIFPNPAIDIIQIQFEKAGENNIIELYTSEGKLLSTHSSNYNALSQIDLSSCGSGTYLLKIHNNTKEKSFQIVKFK